MKTMKLLKTLPVIGALAFSAQAELLYQFTFTGKSGEPALTNGGTAGGEATVVEFAGKGVEFVKDAPVAGRNACDFVLQKSRQRAAKLELPGSENVLRCSQVGDKITVATWVKWRGFTRPSGVASTCPDNQRSGWTFMIMPEGTLRFAAMGGFGHRNSKLAVEKDQWTHIAFSWDVGNAGGLKFYIDGKDAGINVNYIGDKPVPSNDNAVRIGVQTPGFHMALNGQLHDLRLYDELVSPETIAAIAAEVSPVSAEVAK
jgi:hypothetical protein